MLFLPLSRQTPCRSMSGALDSVIDAPVAPEKKEDEKYEDDANRSESKSDGSLPGEVHGKFSFAAHGTEAVVTRKELWSYYRSSLVTSCSLTLTSILPHPCFSLYQRK